MDVGGLSFSSRGYSYFQRGYCLNFLNTFLCLFKSILYWITLLICIIVILCVCQGLYLYFCLDPKHFYTSWFEVVVKKICIQNFWVFTN